MPTSADKTLYFSTHKKFCEDFAFNSADPWEPEPWVILKVGLKDALKRCKLEYHGKRDSQDAGEIRATDDWSTPPLEPNDVCSAPECGPCSIPWELIEVIRECPLE